MKHILCALLCALLVGGCSKEEAGTIQPAQAPVAEEKPLPSVTFAEIVAINPTSSNPLTAQYSASGGAPGVGRAVFRWYVDGTPVNDVSGNVLSSDRFKKGDTVEVEVAFIDGERTGVSLRSAPLTIRNSPPAVGSAALRPVPAFAGDVVSVVAEANDRDGDDVTFEYEWMVNNRTIENHGDRLETSGMKKHDGIMVMVTPADGEDRGASVQSAVLFLSNRNPEIVSTPATGVENIYTYQVIARDQDGDSLTYSLESAPAGMTIDARSGMVRWEAGTISGRMDTTVKIAVDDGDGGVSYQQFSLGAEMR